jgi:tetratricopeptide (TPR) repeat protein
MPNGLDIQYSSVNMHYNLGRALLYKAKSEEAAAYLSKAVSLEPNHAQAHYWLALALADQGKFDQTLEHYSKAVRLNPAVDTSATLNFLLARHYAEARRFRQAVSFEEKALMLANAAGDVKLAKEIKKWLDIYKQLSSSP